MIQITINGQRESLPAATTVLGLLEARDLAGKRLAVERNGEIVPKGRHAGDADCRGRSARDRRRRGWRLIAAALTFTAPPPIAAGSKMNDSLVIAGKAYSSRLLVGTGRVQGFRRNQPRHRGQRRRDHHRGDPPQQHRPEPRQAQPARHPAARALHHPAQHAGCYSADEAVRTLRLARELLDGHELVKLEVLATPNRCSPTCPKPSRPPRPW